MAKADDTSFFFQQDQYISIADFLKEMQDDDYEVNYLYFHFHNGTNSIKN